METEIKVPLRHALIVRGTGPFVPWAGEDGVDMALASPRNTWRYGPFDFETTVKVKHEKDVKIVSAVFDRTGYQYVDPNPMEVPVKFRAPTSMKDLVIEHLQRYMSVQRAGQEPFESLEESMDFEPPISDIGEVITAAEKQFRQGLTPRQPLNPVPKPGNRVKRAREPLPDDPVPDTDGEEEPIPRNPEPE